MYFAFVRYLRDLKEEKKNYESGLPVPWLQAMFHQLGLEVHTHNFTLHHPLGRDQSYSGQNVYAIVRAPRASSTEALVFSVPFRPPNSPEAGTDAAVATLLASAKFFRKQFYWAKDLIFLVTEHEQLGMQAWLEAYHQRSCGSGVLDYGVLEARAGSIQAAINLELSEPKITHLNVKVEGLNGQLPNLDLVNLVNRLFLRERVGQLFQGTEDPMILDSWKGLRRSLNTMLKMVVKQASGVPSGNHGLFHRFGIEALTIEGVTKGKRQSHAADLYVVGRIMEGIFRSLNNLLERFHQSFFFYLLPSSNRYVSIGMYMPGFGLLGGSLVLAALGLWCQAIYWEKDSRSKRSSEHQKKKDANAGEGDEEKEEDTSTLPTVVPSCLVLLLPMVLASHFVGALALYLPEPMSRLSQRFWNMEAEDIVFFGITALSGAGLVILPILGRTRILSRSSCHEGAWRVLKCLVLLELATLAFCVSLCNFSLAAIVSAAYVPFALLSSPSRSVLLRLFKMLLGLAVHPMLLLALVCSVDNYHYMGGNLNLSNFLGATKHALVFGVVDSHIYGSITYATASIFLLPCWQMLWCLNFMVCDGVVGVNSEVQGKKKKSD